MGELMRYLGMFTGSVLVGFGIGGIFFRETYKPRIIYEEDINKDGKKDIVVINDGSDDISLFLRQEDGSFVRSDYQEKELRQYAKSALEKASYKVESEKER